MVKWISNIFDTTDKEINRLRRIVAQANDELVRLLETQRVSVAALREQVFQGDAEVAVFLGDLDDVEKVRLHELPPAASAAFDPPGVGEIQLIS